MNRKIAISGFIVLMMLGCHVKDLNLKVRYNQIYGLDEASRVLFEDNQIGEVARVFYGKDGHYTVDLIIKANFTNTVTEHSRFLIIDDPQQAGKKAIDVIQVRKGGEPLEDGTLVEGATRSSVLFGEMLQQFEAELDKLRQYFREFLEDLQSLPESAQVQELKKELKALAEEMQRAGNETREKIQKEILPLIRKELERLKKKLKKDGRDQEVKPLEEQLDKLIQT
jgi:paraquat-inducible protein B